MTYPSMRFFRMFVVTAVAISLVACGEKEGKQEVTQAAAKVGSEEVSVHQINQVMSRANTKGASPKDVAKISRDILEKLIDQQLAVSQAMDSKLHRTPEVMSQIEAARREILARAYTQKIASAVPKPTADEVNAYYTEHPQLFSQRRIFKIQELVVQAAPGMVEQFKAHVASNKPIENLAAALKDKKIEFGAGSATRAAEQFPLELLAKLHALKDGESTISETPTTVTLIRIASSQRAPVTQDVALRSIEQFLYSSRVNTALAADFKDLRSKTKITYLGEFANSEAVSTPAMPASTPAEQTQIKTAVPANSEKSAIESGVAGLK